MAAENICNDFLSILDSIQQMPEDQKAAALQNAAIVATQHIAVLYAGGPAMVGRIRRLVQECYNNVNFSHAALNLVHNLEDALAAQAANGAAVLEQAAQGAAEGAAAQQAIDMEIE
jgi:hypothetical protein